MQLIDITKTNWENVVSLTTNIDGSHTLIEAFVTSNAYSIAQSVYENGWVTKAIEHDEKIIGFTMYGFSEEYNVYELCRFMIDRHYQGYGYGKEALKIILENMKKQYSCNEIYLSTAPDNMIGRHIYEGFGFVKTGKIWDDEEVYCLKMQPAV